MNLKNEKKVVASFKIEPVYKELIAKGANYLKIDQGDLLAKAVKKFMIDSTDYIQFIEELSKKYGLSLSEIIHRSIRLQSKELLSDDNLPLLIEKFSDDYDLWANEIFGNTPTKDEIEDSVYFPEWNEFIRQEIRNAAIKRINAETNEMLEISGSILLAFMEEVTNVEIEVQVMLSDAYIFRPSRTKFYLELIYKIYRKSDSPFPSFHFGQLLNFMGNLSDDEKTWLYTVLYLLEEKFKDQDPSLENVTKFLEKTFDDEGDYEVFRYVEVEKIVEKVDLYYLNRGEERCFKTDDSSSDAED